jgi:CheY-like chemotaxis protein
MEVLVASSSPHRQASYKSALESLGHQATIVGGGVECLQRLQRQHREGRRTDLLLLESPLHWGGGDGVLAVLQSAPDFPAPPVILVCSSQAQLEWFQLSRFHVDDFLARVPTPGELRSAIERVLPAASERSRGGIAAARLGSCPTPSSPVLSATLGADRCTTNPLARR